MVGACGYSHTDINKVLVTGELNFIIGNHGDDTDIIFNFVSRIHQCDITGYWRTRRRRSAVIRVALRKNPQIESIFIEELSICKQCSNPCWNEKRLVNWINILGIENFSNPKLVYKLTQNVRNAVFESSSLVSGYWFIQ